MPQDAGQTSKRMFDLNRPQGFGKDEYLFMWREANITVFDLIKNNRGNPNNTDVVHAVMMSISLIAHDDLRQKQEILFNEAMSYIQKQNISVEDKNEMVFRLCAITMGNLTSYVDQFRGLAHTLKVGELYNFEKPYAKITEAFKGTEYEGKVEPDGSIVQL